MNFNSVIVDDEPPARNVIVEYLEEVDWVTVDKSLGNPAEALEYLKENEIDLIFLDIQMPGMNGFELISQLEELPSIIFSTAYDEYAIRAFDINAVDYLLKPYTKERFMEALERVKNMEQEHADQERRIQALLKQVQEKKEYPSQLFVRSRDRIIPVDVDDIQWIEAEGDYSKIHFEEKSLLCGVGLGKLLDRLDPDHFARVHRSHALAVSAIKDLTPDGYGGFKATMQNGAEVKVSRNYTDAIKDFII